MELDPGAIVRALSPRQRVFDSFVLTRVVGRGGMGVVWLARDEKLDRDVALKFLPELIANDPSAIVELKKEAKRSLELTHPNIVRVNGFREEHPLVAVEMEYIEGQTLALLRAQCAKGFFEAREIMPWIRQLVAGLDYAHSRRTIHRDLKPLNLMITRENDLKITDFGIAASVTDAVTRVSRVHNTSLTTAYASPQQIMGEPATMLDDVYSLGATIYELLTSRPPFHSGEIMLQVLQKSAPSMTARREELGLTGEQIPPHWETVVAKCLAKEPKQRPGSALAALRQLEGIENSSTTVELSSGMLSDETGRVIPPVPPGSKPASPVVPRRKGLTTVLALVAVAALAYGVQKFRRLEETKREAEAGRVTTGKADAIRVAAENAEAKRAADVKAAAAKAEAGRVEAVKIEADRLARELNIQKQAEKRAELGRLLAERPYREDFGLSLRGRPGGSGSDGSPGASGRDGRGGSGAGESGSDGSRGGDGQRGRPGTAGGSGATISMEISEAGAVETGSVAKIAIRKGSDLNEAFTLLNAPLVFDLSGGDGGAGGTGGSGGSGGSGGRGRLGPSTGYQPSDLNGGDGGDGGAGGGGGDGGDGGNGGAGGRASVSLMGSEDFKNRVRQLLQINVAGGNGGAAGYGGSGGAGGSAGSGGRGGRFTNVYTLIQYKGDNGIEGSDGSTGSSGNVGSAGKPGVPGEIVFN